ncbi:hypothetical protein ADUPG1_012834, partial [Aduncisulcus paluster]
MEDDLVLVGVGSVEGPFSFPTKLVEKHKTGKAGFPQYKKSVGQFPKRSDSLALKSAFMPSNFRQKSLKKPQIKIRPTTAPGLFGSFTDSQKQRKNLLPEGADAMKGVLFPASLSSHIVQTSLPDADFVSSSPSPSNSPIHHTTPSISSHGKSPNRPSSSPLYLINSHRKSHRELVRPNLLPLDLVMPSPPPPLPIRLRRYQDSHHPRPDVSQEVFEGMFLGRIPSPRSSQQPQHVQSRSHSVTTIRPVSTPRDMASYAQPYDYRDGRMSSRFSARSQSSGRSSMATPLTEGLPDMCFHSNSEHLPQSSGCPRPHTSSSASRTSMRQTIKSGTRRNSHGGHGAVVDGRRALQSSDGGSRMSLHHIKWRRAPIPLNASSSTPSMTYDVQLRGNVQTEFSAPRGRDIQDGSGFGASTRPYGSKSALSMSSRRNPHSMSEASLTGINVDSMGVHGQPLDIRSEKDGDMGTSGDRASSIGCDPLVLSSCIRPQSSIDVSPSSRNKLSEEDDVLHTDITAMPTVSEQVNRSSAGHSAQRSDSHISGEEDDVLSSSISEISSQPVDDEDSEQRADIEQYIAFNKKDSVRGNRAIPSSSSSVQQYSSQRPRAASHLSTHSAGAVLTGETSLPPSAVHSSNEVVILDNRHVEQDAEIALMRQEEQKIIERRKEGFWYSLGVCSVPLCIRERRKQERKERERKERLAKKIDADKSRDASSPGIDQLHRIPSKVGIDSPPTIGQGQQHNGEYEQSSSHDGDLSLPHSGSESSAFLTSLPNRSATFSKQDNAANPWLGGVDPDSSSMWNVSRYTELKRQKELFEKQREKEKAKWTEKFFVSTSTASSFPFSHPHTESIKKGVEHRLRQKRHREAALVKQIKHGSKQNGTGSGNETLSVTPLRSPRGGEDAIGLESFTQWWRELANIHL